MCGYLQNKTKNTVHLAVHNILHVTYNQSYVLLTFKYMVRY